MARSTAKAWLQLPSHMLRVANMSDIPKFTLYGEGDQATKEAIQPTLPLRGWSALTRGEKETALQHVHNMKWLTPSAEILETISRLNQEYLRVCPGKTLHNLVLTPAFHPSVDSVNQSLRRDAAVKDFCLIFVHEPNESLVLRMLSQFAQLHIRQSTLDLAKKQTGEKREQSIKKAYESFDILANCLNHIFEQFAVNQLVTRNGFVPRQDEKITQNLYQPTLAALADPRWAQVSTDLALMFDDYREQRYPEVITKAHAAVQRFLQISVGEEGKSGKGELAKLVTEAKAKNIIPPNRFIEPSINAILGYIPSERATNSTAKPAVKETTSSEAMLMMNVVMTLLQFCLQNMK